MDGSAAGRPFAFVAGERVGVLRLSALRSAFALRRQWSPVSGVVTPFLVRSGLQLRVRVGPLPSLRLAPHPGLIARLLLRGAGR